MRSDNPFIRSVRDRLLSWETLALAFLIGFPLFFFWQAALGLRVFLNGDISSVFYPFRWELARRLAQGQLPLWTPNLQSGFPLLAEGQVAALYPPTILLAHFLPVHLAISYSILFHLALTGVGMYALARTFGFRVGAAWLAAWVFEFNGFQLAHLQHLALLATTAWLPWMLAFQARDQRARLQNDANWVWWWLASSGSIALACLAGSPQIAVLSLGAFLVFGLFQPVLWVRRASDMGSSIRRAGALAQALALTIGSLVLGIAIAAAQLLPTAELASLSVRGSELGQEFFTSFSLTPAALTQFLLPFLQLGQPNVLNQEYWSYVGILPLLLILVALLTRRDARTLFFVLFGFGALLLALGDSNPVYGLLYNIPLFNRFRAPARFMLLLILAASFLAATGLTELQDRLRASSGNRLAWRLPGILLAFGAVAVVLWHNRASTETWLSAWTYLPVLLLALGAVMVLAPRLRLLPREALTPAVLGLAIVDLSLFAVPFLATLDSTTPVTGLDQVPRAVLPLVNTSAPYRMLTNVYNESLRPNHPLIYGVPGAQVYSPFALQRNQQYLAALSPAMLNLLNVRYLMQYSDPTPPDPMDRSAELLLDPFTARLDVPPTRVSVLDLTSYTDKTGDVPDGFLAGELILTTADDRTLTLPIRMGVETADWAYAGLENHGSVKHSLPSEGMPFPGYLASLGQEFVGHKYMSRYDLPSAEVIVGVQARSYLPPGELTIENVSLVSAAGQSVSLAALAGRDDFAVVFKSHAVTVLENRDVLPRAFIVHAARIVTDEQALAELSAPTFRPEQMVLLSGGKPLETPQGQELTSNDAVEIVDYAPERVALHVQSDRPGYLVLADTWYPGWEASVDGRSAPLERGDYIFRAVPIEAGTHEVVFEYHPRSFELGLGISMAGLLIAAIISGAAAYRKKRDS